MPNSTTSGALVVTFLFTCYGTL